MRTSTTLVVATIACSGDSAAPGTRPTGGRRSPSRAWDRLLNTDECKAAQEPAFAFCARE
ncbi:hypothetical protein [Cohnella sp. REN36]|uniref:hypothetical protein n=1 Tax=Cohnella sp. REN36 TaxID=2887347 RepID=UPI001D15DBDC|nr:hypothetical protein [Cohnella sp. REN36]MCC3375599.1 hypothetical protein [Cohnella sp. REN36]